MDESTAHYIKSQIEDVFRSIKESNKNGKKYIYLTKDHHVIASINPLTNKELKGEAAELMFTLETMKPQSNPNTMEKYQVGRNYPLFEHMDQEHGLTLLEDQLWQIERIVLKMHGIEPDKCTMNPQSNPHVSRTVAEQIEHQVQEKGNQLDQVYGAMKEEIEIAKELQTSINGWQRVKIDFTVEVKPRWWQFWKPRIDAQDFQWSAWLKPKGEAFLYQPQIEKK